MNESIAASNQPSLSAWKREWWELGRLALLLLALLAAIHAPVWLAGKTLMPWTGLQEQSEWSKEAPRPFTRTAPDTADIVFQLVPWDEYALRCAREGEWPWWNPYQGLGHPHWENIYTTGLSPATWLTAALPVGLKEFVWLGQWWVAAIFTIMLARALGLSWAGTALAGVAVITASHFELYVSQRHMCGTAMWWPLALWGVECLRRSFPGGAGDPRAVALADRLLGFCGVTAGVWGLLTGGNPSIALAGGSGLALYAVARIPWRKGARPLLACVGWLVLAGLSGLAMAAPAWANFLPWLELGYSRKVDPFALRSGPGGLIVFIPRHLGTMLLPYVYGETMEYPFGRIPRWLWTSFGGWSAAVVVFLSLPGAHRAWKQRNAGLLVLALMTLGVLARTYGLPFTEWVAGLPLWQDVNFTRYAAFIPVFGFALLAGSGFDALSGAATFAGKPLVWGRGVRLAVAGIWLTLMSVALYLAFHSLPPAHTWTQEAVTNWRHFAWLGLFWAATPVFLLLWIAGAAHGAKETPAVSMNAARLLWPTVLGLALVAVVFAPWGYTPPTHSLLGVAGGVLLLGATVSAIRFRPEAWLADRGDGGPAIFPRGVVLVASLAGVGLLPLSVSLWAGNGLPPKFDPIPRTGLIQVLAKAQSADYSRSWSIDGLPTPNHAMVSGVFSLNVIDPLVTREEAGFISKHIDPYCPPSWLAGNLSYLRNPGQTVEEAYLSRRAFYQFASVRYVTSLTPLPGLRPLLRDESGMMLWEDIDALPRARLVAPEVATMPPEEAVHHGPDREAGAAEIQYLGPNRVKIRATNRKPCVLVLADAPKAGWSARLNGRPVELLTAHGCFRAVQLPEAGTWEVEMRYRPPWWNFSWLLAGAGCIGFAVPGAWLFRAQRLAARPGGGI